jgi:hypothetical protein
MSTTVKFNNVTVEADYNGLTIRKGIFKRVFVTWAALEHLERSEHLIGKMKDHTVFQVTEPLSGVTVQDGLEFTICTPSGRVDMLKGTAMGLIPVVEGLYQQYRWYKG